MTRYYVATHGHHRHEELPDDGKPVHGRKARRPIQRGFFTVGRWLERIRPTRREWAAVLRAARQVPASTYRQGWQAHEGRERETPAAVVGRLGVGSAREVELLQLAFAVSDRRYGEAA